MPAETNQSMPDLSVVVLCYQAGDLSRNLVTQITGELNEAEIDYELILVANYWPGSDDPTPAIVRDIAEHDSRCRVVSKVKEGRMGWDMRSGLNSATGKTIAIIDGDGQMPCSDITKVYALLKAGKYDLVKTFRARRYDGIYRSILSKVYNMLFFLLFPSSRGLRDINSKPKIMTREAFQKMNLKSNDWFSDAEIMIEALRLRLSIGELGTVFFQNERRSSFIKLSAIWEFTSNLFIYRFKR